MTTRVHSPASVGAICSPTSALSSVDLPALTLPAIATRSGSSSRSRWWRSQPAACGLSAYASIVCRSSIRTDPVRSAADGRVAEVGRTASRCGGIGPAASSRRGHRPASARARSASASHPLQLGACRSAIRWPRGRCRVRTRGCAAVDRLGQRRRQLARRRSVKWSRSSRWIWRSLSRESLPTWNVHLVDVLAHRRLRLRLAPLHQPLALVAHGLRRRTAAPAPIENGLSSAIPATVVARPNISMPPYPPRMPTKSFCPAPNRSSAGSSSGSHPPGHRRAPAIRRSGRSHVDVLGEVLGHLPGQPARPLGRPDEVRRRRPATTCRWNHSANWSQMSAGSAVLEQLLGLPGDGRAAGRAGRSRCRRSGRRRRR